MNGSHEDDEFDHLQSRISIREQRQQKERELQMKIERFKAECQREIKDRAEDEAQFWRFIYILACVAALLVLFTPYRQWRE